MVNPAPAAIVGFSLLFAVTAMPANAAPRSPIEAFDAATSDGQAHDIGLYGGAAIGRGSLDISCADCAARPALDDALSVSAFAGYRLLPRVAVFGEYWLTRWSDRSGPWFGDSQVHDLSQQTISAGTQVWVTDRLWLRAQLGVGRHASDIDYRDVPSASFAAAGQKMQPTSDRSHGAATVLGAGFEWARTRTFAASIELRAARTRPDSQSREVTTGSLSLGAAWF
jgi:hypothetical protein